MALLAASVKTRFTGCCRTVLHHNGVDGLRSHGPDAAYLRRLAQHERRSKTALALLKQIELDQSEFGGHGWLVGEMTEGKIESAAPQ